ncbi:hypothetical protein GPJ56_010142 [Histomonas meleagridis]|uniref:uncharacterized protein n=1 Tax=Histomonas meleagridis TaxID=135588 RepID=UPI00355AA1D5|nr:hypothetical protein GPJ56_010142 [Histomonas meleagridis]KAH0798982.1 hypothetical protein GO595_008217 [Histomonas meleagridis]
MEAFSSDSSDLSEFEDFHPEDFSAELDRPTPTRGGIRLPPPKKKSVAPPPPPPIEVIPPSIAKTVLEAEKEEDQVISVDFDTFREEGEDLAQKNAMIKDKSQYKGVGYQRAKSQLTYLAQLDLETRGAYEQQLKNSTRAKVASAKLYGW